YTGAGGVKRDYADNCERFVFFSRAVLEAVRVAGLWPDVLHLNDWQTGLVPALLREDYAKRYRDLDLRHRYDHLRALLTVHNLPYRGAFCHGDLPLTGLGWELFNPRQLEAYGQLNFLKAGLVYADFLSTVSPTYAREIQTPYFGCGLQG